MDSFPPNLTPTPEPLPAHRYFLNKKFVLTLVLVLVLAGAAYAGLWYWQNQNSNAVVPSATPNQNSVDTSTWKTYTNSQFGFQMGYPSANSNDVVQGGSDSVLYDGLSVIEGPTIDVGPYTIIPTTSDKQKSEMTAWMNRYLNQADTKAKGLAGNDNLVCQRLSVPNSLVMAVSCSDSADDRMTSAIIKNGSVWVFFHSTINPGDVMVPTSDQELKTLSTFKFTNSADTSTWKTYTVQNAFSFKYPNTLVTYDPGVSTSLYISSTFIKLGSSEIRIQVLNPNQSYLPKNNPSFDVTTYSGAKEMSVDGVDAWQYEPSGSGYFLETDIYKMPNVIEVSYVGDAPPSKADLAIYNQILSTFKFTK